MRVVLIGYYKIPYPFSEHRKDYAMLKNWANRMGQLNVIVQGYERKSRIWKDGNLVVHYAPSKAFTRQALGFVVWSACKLLNLHREVPIDIVNGSDLWGGLVGILLRPLIRAKVLAQLQGEFFPPSRFSYTAVHRYLLYMVARFVCRNANMVRCLYQAAAEQVAALGVPMSKIATVPSRCDVGLFDVDRFPPKNIMGQRLLYVGNLIWGKGVHFLLEALPDVVSKYPDVKLTIVGSGPKEPDLNNLADKLELNPHVVFLGRIPHNEIPAVMHDSDLFVFPSLSEATPRAVMEAMAMELPVVATRVGGIPEMIENGCTGLLVDPADSRQLSTAICQALSDPAWAKEAGGLGRKRVLANYTLEKHVQRMVALHYHVVEMNNSL